MLKATDIHTHLHGCAQIDIAFGMSYSSLLNLIKHA